MDMQSVMWAMLGFGPCFALGLYLARRNGLLLQMSSARIRDNSNSYWWRRMICLVIGLCALAMGWALLVVYVAFKPEEPGLIFPLVLLTIQIAYVVLAAGVLVSRLLRWIDEKEEEEKYLHGEGTGY